MKKKMNKLSVIYGLIELISVILMGTFLKIKIYNILLCLLIFILVRYIVKKPMHYKDYRRCYIWTILLFTVIFLIGKMNIYIAYLFAAFSSIIASEKGDVQVNNWFMYDNEIKKLRTYIHNYKNNTDVKLFENSLQQQDKLCYEIYKYKIEGKTNNEIANITNSDIRRISEKVAQIDLAMKVFFNSENRKN